MERKNVQRIARAPVTLIQLAKSDCQAKGAGTQAPGLLGVIRLLLRRRGPPPVGKAVV